jgi:hypothetical protein
VSGKRARLDPQQGGVIVPVRVFGLEPQFEPRSPLLALESGLHGGQEIVVSPMQIEHRLIGPFEYVAPQIGEPDVQRDDRVLGDLH